MGLSGGALLSLHASGLRFNPQQQEGARCVGNRWVGVEDWESKVIFHHLVRSKSAPATQETLSQKKKKIKSEAGKMAQWSTVYVAQA